MLDTSALSRIINACFLCCVQNAHSEPALLIAATTLNCPLLFFIQVTLTSQPCKNDPASLALVHQRRNLSAIYAGSYETGASFRACLIEKSRKKSEWRGAGGMKAGSQTVTQTAK